MPSIWQIVYKVRRGQSSTFEHVPTIKRKQVFKYDVVFKNILKRKLKTRHNRKKRLQYHYAEYKCQYID